MYASHRTGIKKNVTRLSSRRMWCSTLPTGDITVVHSLSSSTYNATDKTNRV